MKEYYSINQTWREFLAPAVQPVLRVLPFNQSIQSPSPSQSNRPLLEGYKQVVEECSRIVNKIVDECRRVNLRYRDLDWDLDWDLKYEKGHCLNYIGSELFPISEASTSGSEANIPKAVKRIHEIFEAPTFRRDVNGSDVKQGNYGDCWLMAALIAWGNTAEGKKCNCVAFNQEIGIYGFVFYRDGQWIHTIIDDKLCLKSPCWDSPSTQRDLLEQINSEDIEKVYRKTYQTGSKALFFSQCKDQNETWLPLIEKAFAKAHGDYASLEGGWVGEGIEDLSGGVTTELLSSDILDLDVFWDDEMSQVNRQFLFGCSTGHLEHGYGERDGICEVHAYVVIDARKLRSGQRLVKLRNPWGETRKGLWEGPWSDGSKEWTAEAQEELKHTFGSDSVFWISYEDLVRKYTLFERTRLFRDMDWQCSQEWVIMSVPWKAEYVAKFHITLTQESPVVIVLAQPDRRYFEGLHGQYSFRLQFRLHLRDKPDAGDYVVRSHGNYFMKRSISADIPRLSAGRYTVHVKVTAERDGDLPSVEEVVKAECKNRENNEKLAQVGHAYDLAYSKQWEAKSRQAPWGRPR
ncbi:cysteine proteinase [Trichoderma barbatum]